MKLKQRTIYNFIDPHNYSTINNDDQIYKHIYRITNNALIPQDSEFHIDNKKEVNQLILFLNLIED